MVEGVVNPEVSVYPLRLEATHNQYWVNGYPIDRATYCAILGLVNNEKVRPDFDHYAETGEWKMVSA